jgi:Protein of unknown function (DUF1360)
MRSMVYRGPYKIRVEERDIPKIEHPNNATAGIAFAARRRRVTATLPGPAEFALSALAVQHISRVLTKDSITFVLRAPHDFREAHRRGRGQRACGHRHPTRLGGVVDLPVLHRPMDGYALVAGRLFTPRLTNGVVTVAALSRMSDYLQLADDALKNRPGTLGA